MARAPPGFLLRRPSLRCAVVVCAVVDSCYGPGRGTRRRARKTRTRTTWSTLRDQTAEQTNEPGTTEHGRKVCVLRKKLLRWAGLLASTYDRSLAGPGSLVSRSLAQRSSGNGAKRSSTHTPAPVVQVPRYGITHAHHPPAPGRVHFLTPRAANTQHQPEPAPAHPIHLPPSAPRNYQPSTRDPSHHSHPTLPSAKAQPAKPIHTHRPPALPHGSPAQPSPHTSHLTPHPSRSTPHSPFHPSPPIGPFLLTLLPRAARPVPCGAALQPNVLPFPCLPAATHRRRRRPLSPRLDKPAGRQYGALLRGFPRVHDVENSSMGKIGG